MQANFQKLCVDDIGVDFHDASAKGQTYTTGTLGRHELCKPDQQSRVADVLCAAPDAPVTEAKFHGQLQGKPWHTVTKGVYRDQREVLAKGDEVVLTLPDLVAKGCTS